MSRTVTLRINDRIYRKIKQAALADRRSLSNFIEFATLTFLNTENFVGDEEMEDILSDKKLLKDLKEALTDVKKGRYKLVPSLQDR